MADILNDRFLRVKSHDWDSVEKKVGLRVSRIYELVKAGTFPKPYAVGGAKLWSEHELNAWIAHVKTQSAA